MTFFGNIFYLRPRSVIYGPSAARGARSQGRKGANKQYSRKKSFYYHYCQYTRPNYIQIFNKFYATLNKSRSQYIELKIHNWTSVMSASTKSVVLLITNRKWKKNSQIQYKTLPISSCCRVFTIRVFSIRLVHASLLKFCSREEIRYLAVKMLIFLLIVRAGVG